MIRPMTRNDLDAVMLVQREAYASHLWEEQKTFANRLEHFPNGCWVAEANGEIGAYILSHPIMSGVPPVLNTSIAIPDHPDCYYIHDLAVRLSQRGHGLSRSLIDKACALAISLGLFRIELVAVQRSCDFWSKNGFTAVSVPSLAGKLETYSKDARYMARRLKDTRERV